MACHARKACRKRLVATQRFWFSHDHVRNDMFPRKKPSIKHVVQSPSGDAKLLQALRCSAQHTPGLNKFGSKESKELRLPRGVGLYIRLEVRLQGT